MHLRLRLLRNIIPQCSSVRCAKYSTETNIKSIYIGSDVKNPARVRGWVKALRKMKDSVFIDINDGTHPKHLQVIVNKSLVPKDLSFGSSIETTGVLSTNASNQFELACDSLKVIGPCQTEEGYPFAAKKTYSDDYLRQYLHLRCRTNRFSSLLRVRHGCWSAVHDYFIKSGFIHIDTPVLTSNDCEGAGEVFKVLPENERLVSHKDIKDTSYFDTKAYLTVSGQLHLEALARSLSNVYCFGPTFRAENSKSRLHLSEFYMVEAESSYITDTRDITNRVESLVKETFKTVLDKCIEDIVLYNKFNEEQRILSDEVIKNITSKQFTVMSYREAADVLEKHQKTLNSKFTRGGSLSKDHELFLVKHNDNVPIFVVDWPKNIKQFYMKSKSDDSDTVLALDLLCPNVGELCGGSVREDDYEELKRRIQELNLGEKLDWYLELRKFGNVPTGGFGLGFERLLQVLLGTTNIKDTIVFPRWPHNCKL